MKTSIVKRSIITGGHKTSVSLEDPFWDAMKEIAALKGTTLIQIVSQIDENSRAQQLVLGDPAFRSRSLQVSRASPRAAFTESKSSHRKLAKPLTEHASSLVNKSQLRLGRAVVVPGKPPNRPNQLLSGERLGKKRDASRVSAQPCER